MESENIVELPTITKTIKLRMNLFLNAFVLSTANYNMSVVNLIEMILFDEFVKKMFFFCFVYISTALFL